MVAPTYSVVMANIRAALLEVEQTIQAGDGVAFAYYTQAAFPYWTNSFTTQNIIKDATGRYSTTVRVQAFLHLGWMTEGVDGEIEVQAQDTALLAALRFAERSHLQCPSFPRGVPSIAPQGLAVTQSSLGRVDTGVEGKSTRAVIIDMQIPVTFQLDTKGSS